MSAYPGRRGGSAATVAGFLASIAVFASLIGTVYRPARVIPAATVVALIALGMGGRHQRLAVFAVTVAALAWVVGMTVAIAFDKPLF